MCKQLEEKPIDWEKIKRLPLSEVRRLTSFTHEMVCSYKQDCDSIDTRSRLVKWQVKQSMMDAILKERIEKEKYSPLKSWVFLIIGIGFVLLSIMLYPDPYYYITAGMAGLFLLSIIRNETIAYEVYEETSND